MLARNSLDACVLHASTARRARTLAVQVTTLLSWSCALNGRAFSDSVAGQRLSALGRAASSTLASVLHATAASQAHSSERRQQMGVQNN